MKKLLILDLDETLIHSSETKLAIRPPDFATTSYYVYKRPHLEAFLTFCKENFKVAVWTSSSEGYADVIVKNIFPENYPLEFVWARRRCTRYFCPERYEFEHLKNLWKIKRKGFLLEQTIMLDDTPLKLKNSYGNLVCIPEYLGEIEDKSLKYLMSYLLDLKEVPNVRKVEKRNWLHRYT